MVEVFENGNVYIDSFERWDIDPIDFYSDPKLVPLVFKYTVTVYPYLNDILVEYLPVLFEKGDNYRI